MSTHRLSFLDQSLELHDTCLVGRDEGCDLVLAHDASVSRVHARLTACAHGVVVEDLKSANGVWVDGVRVPDSVLLVGSHQIVIGETTLALAPTEQQPLWSPTAPTPGALRPVPRYEERDTRHSRSS